MALIGKKLCGAGEGVLLVPGSCRAEILRKVSLSAINRLDSVNISDFEFAGSPHKKLDTGEGEINVLNLVKDLCSSWRCTPCTRKLLRKLCI